MTLKFPDWKVLELRQFHTALPFDGVLEGRISSLNQHAIDTVEPIARKVFALPREHAELPLPLAIQFKTGFNPSKRLLPRLLCLAFVTAPPTREGEDLMFSYAVIAWFCGKLEDSLSGLIQANVKPFDWDALALNVEDTM